MARLKRMFNLNDREGRIEVQVRRITDAIGVDPYDVDLPKVRAHAALEEKEAQSRFAFKSPCWASRKIDFAVHQVLPAMMQQRYPEMASRLRASSPRWGRLAAKMHLKRMTAREVLKRKRGL